MHSIAEPGKPITNGPDLVCAIVAPQGAVAMVTRTRQSQAQAGPQCHAVDISVKIPTLAETRKVPLWVRRAHASWMCRARGSGLVRAMQVQLGAPTALARLGEMEYVVF